MAAREQLTEARRGILECRRRTRRLIQTGGTLDSYGVTSPEQAGRLMRERLADACDHTLPE